jgi:epoxyqueuosine reductase QueG
MHVLTQEEKIRLERVSEVESEPKLKALRPSQCRSHMRNALAEEFRGIVEGFVAAAKSGSCPHVKLANELLQPIRRHTSRKKGTVARYLEKLDKEQLEKERLQKEQAGA